MFHMPKESGYNAITQPIPASEIIRDLTSYLTTKQQPSEICFAGTGDPLLELDTVLAVRESLPATIPIRAHTNGLFEDPEFVAASLANAAFSGLSINLNSASPSVYEKIMFGSHIPPFHNPHDKVLSFAEKAIQRSLNVTFTAVSHPDVDLHAVEELAIQFGAGFKQRSYLI